MKSFRQCYLKGTCCLVRKRSVHTKLYVEHSGYLVTELDLLRDGTVLANSPDRENSINYS